MPNETIWGYGAATTGYPEPYAQFAPAVVDPPEGSEVIEEWEFFYGLAQRLGLQLKVAGVEVSMDDQPTTDDLHHLMTRKARIPLDEVKQHPHGKIWDDPSIVVLAKEEGWTHRLQVGHELMMTELAEVAGEPVLDHAGYRRRRGVRLPPGVTPDARRLQLLGPRHPPPGAQVHATTRRS